MKSRLHKRRPAASRNVKLYSCLAVCMVVIIVYLKPRTVPEDDDYVALRKPKNELMLLRKEAEEEAGESRASRIQSKLATVSSLSSLRDRSTPQYGAFSWLVDEDNRQVQAEDKSLVQRYVLAVLWFATDGINWKDSTSMGWLSSSHECDWKSVDSRIGIVECDEQMRATELQLVKNNLKGSLPSEIRHLSTLEHLDLEQNSLMGYIPEELGYLTNLKYLGLGFNKLEGEIPSTLGGIDNLEQLLTHSNGFKGTVPGSLCDLKRHGRFFNLWSDCKASDLVCTCCTVCCSHGEDCGPVSVATKLQEET